MAPTPPPGLHSASLLETLRHSPEGGYFLLHGHLRRLRASAAALGGRVVPDFDVLSRALEAAASEWPPDEASRVRLLVAPDGSLRVERSTALPVLAHPEIGQLSVAAPQLVRLDSEAVERADATLRHKSTARGVYDAARVRMGVGGASGVADVLLYNEAGELTESSIANLAVEADGGRWLTPFASCGLLPGVMREALLAAGGRA